AALLILAAYLFLPRRGASPAPEPGGRFGKVQRASYGVRIDKILRGEFRSLEPVRSGVEPDDSVLYTDEAWNQIDHKTSARMGKLYAKRFEDEPEIPMMLVIDMSASGGAASTGASKREVAADAAGAVALAAAREGMPVGAVLFTDRVEKIIPPKTGLSHAKNLVRELIAFEPQGLRTELAAPLSEAMRRMPRRGVVAVFSDFNTRGYESNLSAAGHRHILLPVVVEDKLETRPIADLGSFDVVDPETGARGRVASDSAFARRSIDAALKARRDAAAHAIRAAGARPLYLNNEEGYLSRLVAYFQNGGRP
ncbi:MAG: DUF58 domain-containing protein, partial [Elusimicrobia bacterium]|nr:DUF58 domain-containing protein [Elusimicrobiota bacterium]